jgi:hypothetical protein
MAILPLTACTIREYVRDAARSRAPAGRVPAIEINQFVQQHRRERLAWPASRFRSRSIEECGKACRENMACRRPTSPASAGRSDACRSMMLGMCSVTCWAATRRKRAEPCRNARDERKEGPAARRSGSDIGGRPDARAAWAERALSTMFSPRGGNRRFEAPGPRLRSDRGNGQRRRRAWAAKVRSMGSQSTAEVAFDNPGKRSVQAARSIAVVALQPASERHYGGSRSPPNS